TLQLAKISHDFCSTRRLVCDHHSKQKPRSIQQDHGWGIPASSTRGEQAGLTQYPRENSDGRLRKTARCRQPSNQFSRSHPPRLCVARFSAAQLTPPSSHFGATPHGREVEWGLAGSVDGA